jgi:hypothetical protein
MTGARTGLCVTVFEIRGDNTADSCVALQQLEHAAHEVPSVKRLGDEILEGDIVTRGSGREFRGEQAFEPGLSRSRLPYRSRAVERSRQLGLGDDQRKGFRFDPAQGGTSIPDRRHREPLFCKDLSDQGPRSLIAVNDEDLTLYRVHRQLFA